MTCAACFARVEKVTRAVDGIEKVEVNLLSGKMTVYAADEGVTDKIIKAVSNAGYSASTGAAKKKSRLPERKRVAELLYPLRCLLF